MISPTAGNQHHLLNNDPHDQKLLENVHPVDWKNPTPTGKYNLVVVGAGTAGLVSAVGSAGLGAKVAIVERQLMGGDCLNYGCVPSKALLHSAHEAAHSGKDAAAKRAHFPAAMERMRRLRADIAPNDSATRLKGLGIDVFFGAARFTAGDTLEVGGEKLKFGRAVIATGASAAGCPLPGFDAPGILTNETIFMLTELPAHVLVIGGGPIGCELSQALRRLGSEVTLLTDMPQLMPREDRDAAAIVESQFGREGIAIHTDIKILRAESAGAAGMRIVYQGRSGEESITGSHILVAVGREPNTEGLGLEAAGVAYDPQGVKVDDRLQTTNPRIYAAGDICSPYKFTHAADAMARVVIQNALFWGRKKASSLVIPWCTFTAPEIAHVGMYEEEAQTKGFDVKTYRVEMHDMDRAILTSATEGFAKVHIDRKKGRILGATLVGSNAGDLIGELTLAMTAGLTMADIAKTILPYPSQGEITKRLGDAVNRDRLTPRAKSLMETLFRWRR